MCCVFARVLNAQATAAAGIAWLIENSMRLLIIYSLLCTVIRGNYTADERAGLVSLYAATGGAASWATSTGWNTSADVCTWFGISCSAGFVTTIAIANNSLSGNLIDAGPALWQLTELRVLDLSCNNLAGPLPSGLRLLTRLTKLDVCSNQLSMGLPQSWLQTPNTITQPAIHSSSTSKSPAYAIVQALQAAHIASAQVMYDALQIALSLPNLATLRLSSTTLTSNTTLTVQLHRCSIDGLGDIYGKPFHAAAGPRSSMVMLLKHPAEHSTLPAIFSSVLATLDLTDENSTAELIIESDAQLRVLVWGADMIQQAAKANELTKHQRLLQQQCPPGTYTSTSDGVSSCRQCPAGTYRYTL
jgi:Leucine-rich repeat (LRR) protein